MLIFCFYGSNEKNVDLGPFVVVSQSDFGFQTVIQLRLNSAENAIGKLTRVGLPFYYVPETRSRNDFGITYR